MHELNSFSVPQWMLDKMRRQMAAQRQVTSKPALQAPSNHTAVPNNQVCYNSKHPIDNQIMPNIRVSPFVFSHGLLSQAVGIAITFCCLVS